ncbi:hypothetical protein K1X76_07750 [bacterium]|nr:hypothetical protein [bacterium]
MKLSRCLLSVLLLLLMSCSSKSGSGTETANPVISKPVPIAGKAYKITITSRHEVLQVSVQPETLAIDRFKMVSGVSNNLKIVLTRSGSEDFVFQDSQNDEYNYTDNELNFDTDFYDGTNYDVTLVLDDSNNPSLTGFLVNGVSVDATLEVVGTNNPGTAEEAIAAGQEFLKAKDIISARDTYCNELADDPANASLAFGCGWLKLMLAIEQTSVGEILQSFNQQPVNIANDIIGPQGMIREYYNIRGQNSTYQFYYPDFKLPFASNLKQHSNSDNALVVSVIKPLIDKGVSVAQLQALLKQLEPYFIELESHFNKAVGDPSLDFVIPKEFYGVDNNIHAKQGDAYSMLAASQGALVAINLFCAYDYGIQLKDYLIKNGKLFDKAFVADLNGEVKTFGALTTDNIPFLSLLNGSLVTGQKARFIQSLKNARKGLNKIKDDSTDFYPSLRKSKVSDMIVAVEETSTSMTGQAVHFSNVPHQEDFSVNLGAFFDAPPNAQTLPIEAGYPFVIENKVAKPVENYFKELGTGIVEVNNP